MTLVRKQNRDTVTLVAGGLMGETTWSKQKTAQGHCYSCGWRTNGENNLEHNRKQDRNTVALLAVGLMEATTWSTTENSTGTL